MMIGLTLSSRPQRVAPAAPPDPFPAALLAAGGTYHHFAAEDAGATWATRHGTALTLSRRGSPALASIGKLAVMDCTLGAYEVVRATGWPADTPFSLWVLCEHNTLAGRAIYNGPPIYDNSASTLGFRPNLVSAMAGATNLNFTHRSSDAVRSYEWTRLAAGTLSAAFRTYENALALTPNNSVTTASDVSGTVFVVGGSRTSSGTITYAKLRVTDVVLTQGWVLNASQRAALDSYRLARLAG